MKLMTDQDIIAAAKKMSESMLAATYAAHWEGKALPKRQAKALERRGFAYDGELAWEGKRLARMLDDNVEGICPWAC